MITDRGTSVAFMYAIRGYQRYTEMNESLPCGRKRAYMMRGAFLTPPPTHTKTYTTPVTRHSQQMGYFHLDDDVQPRSRDVVAKRQIELKVLHVQHGLAGRDEIRLVRLPKAKMTSKAAFCSNCDSGKSLHMPALSHALMEGVHRRQNRTAGVCDFIPL